MGKPSSSPTVCAPPSGNLTGTPSGASLDAYVGKHIGDICPCDYENDVDNHCAHFVSHAMGFAFGFTCKDMTGKGDKGASIRVHEVFSMCPEVGEWERGVCPKPAGLAFVTSRSNVNLDQKRMTNVPRKHIGIFLGSTVWHYSNKRDKVVKQTIDEFRHHYTGKNITVFWGTFPL